jgi:glyoxylate/hydroxypyruvate reductase A
MSAILLAVTGLDQAAYERSFVSLAPDRDVRAWPERIGAAADIRYACVWGPPPGLLARFPRLAAIFSLGAGVDHLAGDLTLPDVPLGRVVDPDLTTRMTEYVTLHVLMHHRRQRLYDTQQRQRLWFEHVDQPAATEVAVGVMGLGVLGRHAAEVLRRIGFDVAGWTRTPKSVAGMPTFHGPDELDAFLARTEILVCLLPHTAETRGILDLALLRRLRRDGGLHGAYLINAGRGALQVDRDILAALDEGALAGATLDVFPTEPLPADSPFWTHPRVVVTPHNAGPVVPNALVRYVLGQISRFEAGLPLENLVDRRLGY